MWDEIGPRLLGYQVELVNGSNYPVSDISAHLHFDEISRTSIVSGQHGDDVQTWDRVLPGDRLMLQFLIRWADESIDFVHTATLDVVFTDTRGRRWNRTATYELRDITASDEFEVEWYRLPRNQRAGRIPDDIAEQGGYYEIAGS